MTVPVQWRVNAAGRKVGCLSSATPEATMLYRSTVGWLTHNTITVRVTVRDGIVSVTGTFVVYGTPMRRYYVDATFGAGCAPGSASFGDAPASGTVRVDV